MKFFVDNMLSTRLTHALHELSPTGIEVHHLRDKFPPNTPDTEWLRLLSVEAESDWVIVTCDISITRNPHEIRAWLSSGLTAFFLTNSWSHLSFWDRASKLVSRWPDIIDQAQRVQQGVGFIVKVTSRRMELIS